MPNHLDELKDELKCKLEGDELLKFKFSPGNVFWIKKSGKLVRILKTGDYMDADVLYKYMNKCVPLVLERLINDQWIEQVFDCFMNLKHAKTHKEELEAREQILNLVGEIFWKGTREGSLIDLIHLGEKTFYSLDEELTRELYQGDMTLFRRNAFSGMMSVMFSLLMGYTDYKFLSDLYHIGFFIDYSLIKKDVTFNLREAIEEERRRPGEGVKLLSKVYDAKNELNELKNHPEESFHLVKEKLSNLFHSKDCFHLLLKHHEALNGAGFPHQLGENELSDLDTIFISSARCFPLGTELNLGDGKEFFKDIRKYISNRISVSLKTYYEGEANLAA